MRISELAQVTSLPIDTIRFYEKRGLLNGEHFSRQDNGYRDYSQAAVQRLQLIRQAKIGGFTLSEIHGVIADWENETLDYQEKCRLLKLKIDEVKKRICDLQEVQVYLEYKLQNTTK